MAVWNEDAHPRASAGTATGGQFAAGGSAPAPTTTVSAHPGRKSTAARLVHARKVKAPAKGGGGGRGAKGGKGNTRVRTLQAALNRLGATDGKGNKLTVDGKFGPLTTQAVKKAQAALGLPVDGRVSPKLLQRLAKLKTLPVRAKASVTAAELLFGPSAVWEAWDSGLHPRGFHGYFSASASGAARHSGQVDPEADARIHAAYRSLVKTPGGRVDLADLREHPAVAGLSRERVDRALVRVGRGDFPHGDVIQETNQKRLTARDHAAAVRIGDQPNHMIEFSPGYRPPGGTPEAPRPPAEAVKKTARSVTAAGRKPPPTDVERELKGLRRGELEKYAARHGVKVSPLDTDAAIRERILRKR